MPSGGEGLAVLPVETIARFVEDHTSESSTLDFKKTLVLDNREAQEDLVRDVTAFANALGGWIIVGISEEEMLHRAASWWHLSTTDAEGIRQRVVNLCSSHIHPAIPGLDVQIELVPETSLVIIGIPGVGQTPHAVIGFDGKTEYYVRVNDTKRQMTPSDLQAAFARTGNWHDTPKPGDNSRDGRSAVEEALKEAEKQTEGVPFFCTAAAPIALHADALDLQSKELKQAFGWDADDGRLHAILCEIAGRSKMTSRSISASADSYDFSLRDDGLMTWGVAIGDRTHFFQSWRDDRERVFNQYAVVGYLLSFVRLFCALRGVMKGTAGPYAIQMVYSECQNITLHPGHIGLERYPSEPLPEDLDKGHVTERLIRLPYDPRQFTWLSTADQITHDLLKCFYQAFGYTQEKIPFWDDKAKVFDLDSR